MRPLFRPFAALAAALLLSTLALPAQAQCTRHLAYVDLITGGTVDTTGKNAANPGPLEIFDLDGAGNLTGTTTATGCARANWFTAVVRIDLPAACERAVVWLDYDGTPSGWTVNIGDSETNNGHGGDGGSLPAGQNAEAEVLNEMMRVYSAADNPTDVDLLVEQRLALFEGALRFTVEDQRLTVGQPATILQTPDLERLFFLPTNPVAPENRVLWVGLNRTVATPSRDGCGLSKAIVMFE